MRVITTAAALVVLAAGACQPQAPLMTSATFNPDEVAWSTKDGANTVTGFAVLRTVGGEARTCAGLQVYLMPDSAYARERLFQLYGSTEKGSRAAEARATSRATATGANK